MYSVFFALLDPPTWNLHSPSLIGGEGLPESEFLVRLIAGGDIDDSVAGLAVEPWVEPANFATMAVITLSLTPALLSTPIASAEVSKFPGELLNVLMIMLSESPAWASLMTASLLSGC